MILLRATLNIPDRLISDVQSITGEKSKTKAITTAMKEFIKQKKIKKLIAIRGKMKIEYDWKKAEELELEAQNKRESVFERRK